MLSDGRSPWNPIEADGSSEISSEISWSYEITPLLGWGGGEGEKQYIYALCFKSYTYTPAFTILLVRSYSYTPALTLRL